MADSANKEFFTGTGGSRTWTVCHLFPKNGNTPDAESGNTFTIKNESGSRVSFVFGPDFGDGQWDAHCEDGDFLGQSISANIQAKDKHGNVIAGKFEITKDAAKEHQDLHPNPSPGKQLIRCKVSPKFIAIGFGAREEVGEFGAEDDG